MNTLVTSSKNLHDPAKLSNQIACVKREIDKRIYVYPNMIARGKMTTGSAEYEINCMKAVYNTLVLVERKKLYKSFNQLTSDN